MIDQQYKFPCDDLAHDSYKWGIEYANDIDGDEVVHVEWFTTEEERNQVIKGTHVTGMRGEAYTFEKLFNQHSKG
tara:strand:+ start:378 stop:602 length:225 start_codon:yes stop_codon:yes gene_type:complete